MPLSVSEFSTVIARLQQAKPDWVMTLLVGQNQSNYYPQAAAAGLKFPMVSTVNMAQGYEHKRFAPPSLAGMHNAIQYQMEVPTNRNRAFVKRWMAMFPDDQYIGEMAQNTYFTIHLYAKAVRLAGTTNQETVKKALEAGWSIEAPEGAVFLEPGTHHCAHYIRLAVCDENHNVSFVREWPMIQAWWLQRLGVNLIRTPEYKQYTPGRGSLFRHVPQGRQEEELACPVRREVAGPTSPLPSPPPTGGEGAGTAEDGYPGAAGQRAVSARHQRRVPVDRGDRAHRHSRHDEHHQPGAWRIHDGGRLYRHDRHPSRPALPAGAGAELPGGGGVRRAARAPGDAPLLWRGARRAGSDLGDQPHPGPGHADLLRPVHAVDRDSRAAPSRSANIPSRDTGSS